ncbi:hypothetical protein Aph02nite_64580 [Actinoplanes philippinensis]|nr:hypothetical protein Aph02nite_64580 [Actinoplanes philippinensis]
MTPRYPWARALTALAGIAALLGVLVAVTSRAADEGRAAAVDRAVPGGAHDPAAGIHAAIDEYMRRFHPWLDPVPMGEVVTMTGGPAFNARLQADRVSAATYMLRIENTGTQPFDGSFSDGCAWLEMDDGERYPSPFVSNLNGWLVPSVMEAGTGFRLLLTFDIPAGARLAALILCFSLGRTTPTAVWSMTP